MRAYSFQEIAEKHLCYGHAKGNNIKEARRLYQQSSAVKLPRRHFKHLL
jgi:hypothetical protein